jgi:DNA-binding NtrC family response regulator
MTGGKGAILVVDDKETMLSLLQRILGTHHDVVVAGDSQQALEILGARSIDVVLTDVRMPGADGFELIRLVRQRWPATEVVMMTAYASIEAAVRAIREGAYDYLQKPFDPDEVALVVARALERKRENEHGRRPSAGAAEAEGDLALLSYKDAVNLARERMSHDYLTALLRTFKGNVTQAADRAGIERESLHRLLRRYGVSADSFREGDAEEP